MKSSSKKLPAGYWIVFAALCILALTLIGKTADRESQLYVALYQAGYWASQEASANYPHTLMLKYADDKPGVKRFLAKREEFYLERKRVARQRVMESFKVSQAEADRVQTKGDSEHWKVFDDPRLFFPQGLPPSDVPP